MASAKGTATIDFGSPSAVTMQTSVVVSGQTGLTAGGWVEAWLRAEATADHSVDEIRVHGPRVLAEVTGAGTFTIWADAAGDRGDHGEYLVNWVWMDP